MFSGDCTYSHTVITPCFCYRKYTNVTFIFDIHLKFTTSSAIFRNGFSELDINWFNELEYVNAKRHNRVSGLK